MSRVPRTMQPPSPMKTMNCFALASDSAREQKSCTGSSAARATQERRRSVRQAQKAPEAMARNTRNPNGLDRDSAIGVSQGPGKAGKAHSQAVVACPSSCTHMLRKMRARKWPGPVETIRKAPASAAGMAQVRSRPSSRVSASSHSVSTASALAPANQRGRLGGAHHDAQGGRIHRSFLPARGHPAQPFGYQTVQRFSGAIGAPALQENVLAKSGLSDTG